MAYSIHSELMYISPYELVLNFSAVPSMSGYVLFEWFVNWEVSGRTAAVLWGVASRIYSKYLVTFLFSSPLALSPWVLLKFIHIDVLTATTKKKPHFILLERLDFHMINILSIEVQAFAWHILTSLSVDKILLPK